MKPATPLPWKREDGHFQHVRDEDVDYFIHAANAYPRLVEFVKKVAWHGPVRDDGFDHGASDLLDEIGESE